jgi:hypothetical protein
MKLSRAKKIAEHITNEQLQIMFDYAKKEIKDWSVVSNINKGLTKGAAWNIYAKSFKIDKKLNSVWILNAVREFGDHLPGDIKRGKTNKGNVRDRKEPYHEEPVF